MIVCIELHNHSSLLCNSQAFKLLHEITFYVLGYCLDYVGLNYIHVHCSVLGLFNLF